MDDSPCVQCQLLDQQLSVAEPHEAQQLLGTRRLPYPCDGHVETYLCAVCGHTMLRDMDKADDFARWEFGR